MKTSSTAWLLCATVVALVSSATPARAQGAGAQGSAGLFGRTATNPNARQKLDITASSTGQLDEGAGQGTATGAAAGGQDSAGYSTMLESVVDYALRGRSAQLRVNGASAQRYFRPLDNLLPSSFGTISDTGAVHFVAHSRKSSLTLSQTGLLSSSPLYGLFTPSVGGEPGDAPVVASSYAVHSVKSYSYSSGLAFGRQLSTRTTMSATLDWQHTDTLGATAGKQTLNMYGVGGQVTRRVARNTTATAGYVYRVGQIDDRGSIVPSRRLEDQGLDLGINHRQPLSATRHIEFGASVRAAAVLVPQLLPASVAGSITERRTTQYSGQVSLGYEFARRWQARTAYLQGMNYVPGISQPIFEKSVSTSIVGLPSSRLDVLVSGAYSTGQSAFDLTDSTFETYTGDARLRVALARTCAAYVEYLYYVYDSHGTQPLVPGTPRSLERNTVRVGLVLRIPAL